MLHHPISLDGTLGAVLIGGTVTELYCASSRSSKQYPDLFLSPSLYGIACVQSYIYYKTNEKDGKLIKAAVSFTLDPL